MEGYCSFSLEGADFQYYSISHIISLGIIALCCAVIFIFANKLKKPILKTIFCYGVAALIVIEEVLLIVWYIYHNYWSPAYSLPLHLCGISVILTAIMLITKSERVYEIVYFWGLAGASQALFTPELGYGYPHFLFFQFFVSHGLIIISILFMTKVYDYRPGPKSVIRVFLLTNCYAALIAVVNLITGGNYLFICRKPSNGSLLDYLGPWPWYIISLQLLCILVYMLCYLPFYKHPQVGHTQVGDGS